MGSGVPHDPKKILTGGGKLGRVSKWRVGGRVSTFGWVERAKRQFIEGQEFQTTRKFVSGEEEGSWTGGHVWSKGTADQTQNVQFLYPTTQTHAPQDESIAGMTILLKHHDPSCSSK